MSPALQRFNEHGSLPRSRQVRRAMSIADLAWLLEAATITVALRSSGTPDPTDLDGPITSKWFDAYVGQTLLPILQPVDLVNLDNLPASRVAAALNTTER